MASRNTMKTHGFIPCTPMRDLGAQAEKPTYKRTPYQMDANELLKRLCDKGPDGCGEQCESWEACLYGKAIVEKMNGMIIAKITLKSKHERIVRYFDGWKDIGEWMTRHHDHIIEVNAKLRKADEIRQGREKDE